MSVFLGPAANTFRTQQRWSWSELLATLTRSPWTPHLSLPKAFLWQWRVLLLEEGFDQLTSFSLCFTELFFSGPISFFNIDLGHSVDLYFNYFPKAFWRALGRLAHILSWLANWFGCLLIHLAGYLQRVPRYWQSRSVSESLVSTQDPLAWAFELF